MNCSITDGPQYDDDDVEVPTDPKAIQAAKLNAVLEEIALCEDDDEIQGG